MLILLAILALSPSVSGCEKHVQTTTPQTECCKIDLKQDECIFLDCEVRLPKPEMSYKNENQCNNITLKCPDLYRLQSDGSSLHPFFPSSAEVSGFCNGDSWTLEANENALHENATSARCIPQCFCIVPQNKICMNVQGYPILNCPTAEWPTLSNYRFAPEDNCMLPSINCLENRTLLVFAEEAEKKNFSVDEQKELKYECRRFPDPIMDQFGTVHIAGDDNRITAMSCVPPGETNPCTNCLVPLVMSSEESCHKDLATPQGVWSTYLSVENDVCYMTITSTCKSAQVLDSERKCYGGLLENATLPCVGDQFYWDRFNVSISEIGCGS